MSFYQVLEGIGVMTVGTNKPHQSTQAGCTVEINKGDIFVVPENMIHQLHNPGPESLIVIFGCPQSHITTDRVLVDGFVSN